MGYDPNILKAPETRRLLLAGCRACLAELCASGEEPGPIALPPGLAGLVSGLFVTLRRGGELRGCIGHISGRLPLEEALPALTWAAAREDRRFPPVARGELPLIRIELSFLTPPQAAAGWEAIEIGRHGMVLRLRGHQAVFLPQVAPEMGWDLPTTLSALVRKAGLGPEEWRSPDCRFETFEAIHFAEDEA